MKHLRTFLTVLLGMTAIFGAYAQTSDSSAAVKKKLAVYVTGEDVNGGYKKVIGSKLVSTITGTNEFAAVERTADFLAALAYETDYQISGEVRDNQIVKLGQKFGVRYVLVADVSEIFDELFIALRLINVESGLVEKSSEISGAVESMQQLTALADKAANTLMGGISGNGGNYSSRSGAVQEFTVNGVTFEMIPVEGGSFMMGSYEGESDEQPVHPETVASFMIGKTEVTQLLWVAVMGSNPSAYKRENSPVTNVSWYDVQTFISRLNQLTGRQFRLPSEAEWEYAAKGGNKSQNYKYSGSNDPYAVAWYDNQGGSGAKPVAAKQPNELGIYDMSGNVWEWCQDCYSSNYNSPRNSSFRVCRGGGWCSTAGDCRSALRNYYTPSFAYDGLGFRLAL